MASGYKKPPPIPQPTQRRGSDASSKPVDSTAAFFMEEFKKFKEEMREEFRLSREEAKEDMHKELGAFGKKLDKISKDIDALQVETKTLNTKTEELEGTMNDLQLSQKKQGDKQLTQEMRYREKCLKLRGIPEDLNDDLYGNVLKELAKYLEMNEEELEFFIDKIFRINSAVAKERKLPRDVVVVFIKSKYRDLTLQRSYTTDFRIGDSSIKVYKDIPIEILRKRQDYKFLTLELGRRKIPYSWERIEGVAILYKQKRYRVNTVPKAKDFLRKLRKEDEKLTRDEPRMTTRQAERQAREEEEKRKKDWKDILKDDDNLPGDSDPKEAEEGEILGAGI